MNMVRSGPYATVDGDIKMQWIQQRPRTSVFKIMANCFCDGHSHGCVCARTSNCLLDWSQTTMFPAFKSLLGTLQDFEKKEARCVSSLKDTQRVIE